VKPETREQVVQLRRKVDILLRNPAISMRRKILVLVVAPPLAVVVTLVFAVRHYALEARRLVRQRGRA
jgi:hypothetical protein